MDALPRMNDEPRVQFTGRGGEFARLGTEISPRRLQIFWAVAHAESVTRAAKMLGVTQPSLSQQLGSLEAALGHQLFERRSNVMVLTEFGAALLPRVEQVLRSFQELEDGLTPDGPAMRQTVRIAGATSAMRRILPATLGELLRFHPNLNFDLHEGAPGEVLDLLYARRVNVGIIAATAVAESSAGFQQLPILEDPYVLMVPRALDLSAVGDPERDLAPEARRALNSTLQFVFGTQHSRRIQEWYDQVLPRNLLTARTRSFELAIDMVRQGLGVCVAPTLAVAEAGMTDGLRLYATGLEPRRVVAMFPSQYRRKEPYARLITLLSQACGHVRLPPVEPMPPFVAAVRDGGRA